MHRGVPIRLEVIEHSDEAVFFLSREEFWKVVEAVGNFARDQMCRGHFVGSFGVLFRRRIVVDFDGVNFFGFLFWRGVLIYIDSFGDGVLYTSGAESWSATMVSVFSVFFSGEGS